MNWMPVFLLFVAMWIAIFVQTQFSIVFEWIGIPLNLIPALMVHAALTHSPPVIAGLALFAGLGLEALSPMKLGLDFLPLVGLGLAIQTRRHLILRDQTYARVSLGLAAGIFVPLATLVLLSLTDRPIIVGWSTAWNMTLSGLLNAVACPCCFSLFDSLDRLLGDPKPTASSFRPDRQIVRGRH